MSYKIQSVLFCTLLCFSQPVFAQENNSSNPESLYKQAEAHYNLQEYQEALDLFRKAYLLSNEPALLLNIGQCYRFLEQFEDALTSFEVYLREDPDTPYREKVNGLIEEMKEQIKQSASSETEIEPVLTIEPNNEVNSSANLPTSSPALQDGLEKPTLPVVRSSKLLYGAGITLASLGLVSGVFALSSLSQARNEFDRGLTQQSEDSFQLARTTGVVADIFVASGIILGVSGFIFARKEKKAQRQIDAKLSPTGASLSIRF